MVRIVIEVIKRVKKVQNDKFGTLGLALEPRPVSRQWVLLFLQDLFFNVGTPRRVHLFDHLLLSIFQSSITHYIN